MTVAPGDVIGKNLARRSVQRYESGLAELRGPGADNFWSWRSIMYKFALTMTPDDMEAVAAQLYMEMLEAGFGRVGEFHEQGNWYRGGAGQMLFTAWLSGVQHDPMAPKLPAGISQQDLLRLQRF